MSRKQPQTLRERFLAFDDQLAAKGVPPLTAWWRKGIGRWLDAYERRHVLELWACVGRGAAKSTALYKLATFFTLEGDFLVPPGERHFAIVLSRLKEEAEKGIDIIDGWLAMLGVPRHVAGDVVELDKMPRGIRVVAASVAATSGWRAYFVGKDERSKWPLAGVEEREAEEIDTSAGAMTATHEFAPLLSFGSAWVNYGGFFDAVTAGTDAHRIVLGPAPTWVAAPHISEESTRRKERNPRKWAREFACEFQSAESAAFDPDDVEVAFRDLLIAQVGEAVVVVDPSEGKHDDFTWSAWRHVECRDGAKILQCVEVDGLEGAFAQRMPANKTVDRIAAFARRHGAKRVYADQKEQYAFASYFKERGLPYIVHAWTEQSKTDAVEALRGRMRDRLIVFPEHKKLRQQLLRFEEKFSKTGRLVYAGRGYDDYAALALTAVMAADVGKKLRKPPSGAHIGATGAQVTHVRGDDGRNYTIKTFGGGAMVATREGALDS
jgi:hypothetical protein